MRPRLHLALMLGAALALRLLVWWTLPYRDFISDEGEYWAAAVWLANGRGFSFFDQWIWTRPPLYVVFLAVHARLFGAGEAGLAAARLSQALSGVLLVYLVVLLGRRLAPEGAERRVGLWAGWAMALSYSFATFGYLLLSETIFLALFLPALLALLAWADSGRTRWLVAGAALLGLCVLTKALVLNWLPLALLWVVWTGWKRSEEQGVRSEKGAGPSFLFPLSSFLVAAAVVCAVVLPWSAYATARWGHGKGTILVDTTGGYNFALGAQTGHLGERREKDLHDTLCGSEVCDIATSNHAVRQATAYALGMDWIRERPGGFVRKTTLELLDMVQLQYGGAERMRQGYTEGDVPAPHLLGLLADDTLYFLALPLAALGLFLPQGRRGKGLVVSWLLYNIAVGALAFAINRFRQPLLPLLLIYAACALAQWRALWPMRRRHLVAYLYAGTLLLLVLPSYLVWPKALDPNRRATWQETIEGFEGLALRAECEEIEALLRSGDVARARTLHDEAHARQKRNCLALINAWLLEFEQSPQAAWEFLGRSNPSNIPEASARILLLEGDMYRRHGLFDDARQRFVARNVDSIDDQEWAWDQLRPPPTSTLDLGTGFDYGYIRGFFQAERDTRPYFRWAGERAELRFPGAGTGQPQTLTLSINGYTTYPGQLAITPVAQGQRLPALRPNHALIAWQEFQVALPPTPPGADVVVRLESPVFPIGPRDLEQRVRSPHRHTLRLVSFQLDWARLE